jgi:hypothetical protein
LIDNIDELKQNEHLKNRLIPSWVNQSCGLTNSS